MPRVIKTTAQAQTMLADSQAYYDYNDTYINFSALQAAKALISKGVAVFNNVQYELRA